MKYLTTLVMVLVLLSITTMLYAQATRTQTVTGARVTPGPQMTGVIVSAPGQNQMIQLYGVEVPANKAAQAQKFMHDQYKHPASVRIYSTDYGSRMTVNGQDLGKTLIKKGFAQPNSYCQNSSSAYCNSIK